MGKCRDCSDLEEYSCLTGGKEPDLCAYYRRERDLERARKRIEDATVLELAAALEIVTRRKRRFRSRRFI